MISSKLEEKFEGSPRVKGVVKRGNLMLFACTFNSKEGTYLIPEQIMKEKYVLELIAYYETMIVIDDIPKK